MAGASAAEVENAVLEIIAQKAKLERSAVDRTTELTTLDIDSLDVIELMFQIEETFDVSLPYNANLISQEAGGGFKTLGDVVDFVAKHVAQSGEPLT